MNSQQKPMQIEPISMATIRARGNPVELPGEFATSLLQAGGAAHKESCDQRLKLLEESLRRRLSSGLARTEYPECEALFAAITRARQVLRLLPANASPKQPQ